MSSPYQEHDITLASFAQIAKEIGPHSFNEAEYAVLRRIIHTTADFEFIELLRFAHQPFEAAIAALSQNQPIVTDVSMVAAGIKTVASRTWQPPILTAVTRKKAAAVGQTRSAAGIKQCASEYPGAIYAIGNAPTALLALCDGVKRGLYQPALIVATPVGFINVVESKQALSELCIPHILVTGRKGGSTVAAAIINALMIWAWDQSDSRLDNRSSN